MSNEYDDLVAGAITSDKAQAARVGFVLSADTSPDAYAEAQRVAKRTGVPVETALNMPKETGKQARVAEMDFDALAAVAPATAGLLADVDKAKLAHDDIDNMTAIEKGIYDLGKFEVRMGRQFAGGAVEAAGMAVSGTGHLLDITQRALARGAGVFLPKPMAGGRATTESLTGDLLGQDWRTVGGEVKGVARNDIMVPAAEQQFSDQVAAGLGQVASQIVMLPAMGGFGIYAQGADTMAEKIAPDIAGQGNKDLAILLGAGVTGVTEKWALDKILGPMSVGVKNKIAASLARIGVAAAAEGGQEFSENVLQDMLRVALTNPEASVDLIDSLGQGGVGATVGGIVRGVVEAGLHIKVRHRSAEQAEPFAETLTNLNKLAEASKVRERDTETAQAFFQSITDEGTDSVWISPQALAQSGVANLVAQAVPAVAQQIDTAVVSGHDIRLPIADLLAQMPGPELDALIPHVASEPGGFTQTTAKEYLQSGAAQELQAEVERVMQEQQEGATHQQEVEAIKADIKGQMDAAARFTPQVNDAYAALVGNFYAVQAARLGISPQEMYQRYRLRVQAEGQGGQQFDQATPDSLLQMLDADATKQSGIKPMSDEEVKRAEAEFLSHFPKGTRYTHDTRLLDRVRRASEVAANDLRGNPAATRVDAGTLGPFSGYETRAVVLDGDSFNPGGRLEIQVFGREQVEQGLTDEPALTFTVSADGELSVNGPVPSGDTFAEFKARGWADRAVGAEGVQQAGWSALKDPANPGKPLPLAQIMPLLADVHARVREWRGEDRVGLHWTRATGALGGLFGDDATAVFFQKVSRDGTPQTETPAFKNWFGDSKVVDAEGKPLVVYHGTNDTFTKVNFKKGAQGLFWFTSDRASIEKGEAGAQGTSKIMELYAKIENPAGWAEYDKYSVGELQGMGYDGVILPSKDGTLDGFIFKDSAQVKSATRNRGTFDPNNPSILAQATGNRGSFNPSTNTITLLKNADLSTFLHESGHFFLEVMADMAAQPDAPAEVQKDMAALLMWFGIGQRVTTQGRVALSASDIKQGESLRDMAERFGMAPRELVESWKQKAPRSNTEQGALWASMDGIPELALYVAEHPGVTHVRENYDKFSDTTLVPPDRTESQSALEVWFNLPFEEKRSYHEQFARGFEAYLYEGKAPSIEVQGLFQLFRAWLLQVYKSLQALNVELTDEVRGVMDRMLASSEQIRLAEQARNMLPIFETAEQAGMSVEEFAAYHALGSDASNEAVQELQTKGLRDMRWMHNARGRVIKKLQKEAKARRLEVQAEARSEVMAQPIYQAWQFLTGVAKEDGPAVGKLNTDDVASLWLPGHVVDRLSGSKMLAKTGLHPDVVAAMFGFTSGDQLVRELATVEAPKYAVEGLTDQKMLEQYGELASPEAIEREADKAVHNDVRMRMVATELAALERATGPKRTLTTAAKAFAEQMVARLKVRDLRPSQYANGEARSAKAAGEALKKGDVAVAAAEKRNQLIQGYAAKATYNARDEVEAGVRYLKKFDGQVKNLDPEYLAQIAALLERFDLRKISNKEVARRASLAEWAESQREQGLEPDIPADLLNEALRTPYKTMTLEAFRGLVDTVKQIEHLGRLKHKLLTALDQRTYEEARDFIVASINEHAQGREADTRTPTTNLGRIAQGFRRFWAAHIKVASWARIMDGGRDGGPVWEYFIRSANERGDSETRMRAEATAKLSEILAPVFAQGKMGGAGQYFPSIKRSLNREARITIALNTGNEGNLQRLIGGEGWTVQQILPVLQSLTKEEWAAVQAVWDHFESYRPLIGAKEMRVYGKEPEWVAPGTSITLQFGLRGGYYPIKYDPAASQRAEEHSDAEAAKRQLQGAYTSATTRRSFTKARVEEVSGRPLLYTLAGVYSGVNDVIHDLNWHEWLIDANRLMRSQSIDAAIRSHYGPEVKAQFKSWAADIAAGERGTDSAVEQAIGRMRQGVSAAGLGFNVMSAMIQPLGITQSMVRIGAGWAARGVAKYVANPVGLTREVTGKSSFMAERSRTRFRELNELRNQVQDQTAFKELVGRYAYWLMMRFQQMVDVPTWRGAYEKALASGADETHAVALADQAVIDAQGSGMTKDLSAIERGGPLVKLFTTFYSFMNTALNVGVQQTMTANTPAKRGKLAADYLLLYVVPAVLGLALKNALTPGDSGDDEDMGKLAKRLAAVELDYLMGLMVIVREFGDVGKTLVGANDLGRDYTGPAGLRLVTDAGKAAKQTAQGEFDDGFRKALVNLVGDIAALPSAQINRTVTGAQALKEGKTINPAALVFGYQEKR